MGSKILLVLALLVAIVSISSKAAARDLAETSVDHKKNDEKATGRNEVDRVYGGAGGGVHPRPFGCGRRSYRACIPKPRQTPPYRRPPPPYRR